MKEALWSGVLLALFAAVSFGQSAGPFSSAASQRALLDQYCAGCHSDKLKTGGLSLATLEKTLDGNHIADGALQWEKVILKLRAGMMPPPGLPRPDAATTNAFAAAIENGLDHAEASHPNPGRPALHRLNRTEYANSIRDLLDLDVDPSAVLPPDDMSRGFDNMAEVLNISPTLMDAYVRAAGQIAREAVGDPGISPLVATYHIPQAFSQLQHIEGTPFGTRGGIAVRHNFPADGEYVFKMTFYYASIGNFFGESAGKGQQIEVAVNGERVALLDINPHMKVDEDLRTPPIKIKAGPQTVSAAFIMKAEGPVPDSMMPFQYALSDLSTGHIPGLTGLPHLRDMAITGPFHITGIGDTPSRRRIFVCRPTAASEEVPCARKIISSLARQAFRRPVTDTDLEDLLNTYQAGRNQGDPASPSGAQAFDSGIRLAVQAIVGDPEFVFRFERTPAGLAPGANFRISDLELASRLSYFLWSSTPDDELIGLAGQNKLHEPAVLEKEVRRMIADSRSEALSTNFAGEWLELRNLKDVQPDNYVYPDFDKNLADSMRRETELLVDSIMREDRNVLDLLTAKYTFVNERLAIHYKIPNVTGNRFRRIEISDENRYGILGQASILTVTSLANRTSPVQRGKWVMDVILGTPPPTPPPNVPPLKANNESAAPQSVRERMEQHRTNEPCHSCHQLMDPIGFSLENFDATGAWRINDSGSGVDPSGQLFDGAKLNGPASLRQALVSHSDSYIRNFTVRLLEYALGRGVEYYDMPAVRSIDREAAGNGDRFSSFVLGIVKSVPFQMSRAPETAPVTNGAAVARLNSGEQSRASMARN